MSRILFDQNTPVGVRQFLVGHDVSTAYGRGCSDLSNAVLLSASEAAGFDLLISCDQNLAHQQNLHGRRIGVLVLDTNSWAVIAAHGTEIARAVANAAPGSFTVSSLPRNSA